MAISGISASGARGYYNQPAGNQRKPYQVNENVRRYQGRHAKSSSTTNFLRNYSNVMSNLMSSANALRGINSSGVTDDYTVSSSNTDVASATMRWPMHSSREIGLEVDQIAKAQKNVSDSIRGDDTAITDMNFQINGADTISVSVNARNSDGTTKTNQQMLEEAARQINQSGAGVSASVVDNDGMISLEIESNKTGTSNQFTVTGSLGAASGLENASVHAQNAEYRVTTDGQTHSYTSQSNDIQLETGKIGVTLKGTGRTDISVHSDTDKIASAVEDLVKNYNSALEFLGKNADRGTGVVRQLDNLTRDLISSKSLEKLGIKRGGDGTLTFDKNVFKTNMEKEPGLTRDLLSGSFGFAQRAYMRAQSGLSANSASLINREFQDTFSVRYADGSRKSTTMYGRYGYSNPYNYFPPGLLMDFYG